MSEWQSVTLGQISTQRKGINYKSEDYGDQHSGHPFLTIKCFVKGGGYEPSGIKFYDGFSAKPDHLRAGDILFSVTDLTRAGDIVGSPLKVPDFGGNKPALASMDCMRIEPIIGKCNKDFLFHRLMHPDVRRRMVAYSAGSTVLHLDTKKVPTITVRIPINTREQERIATILTGIDTTIEKTEALIAKYQQIKAGLMHDLFTRGLTADGKLRPPREQAPELYQKTPIGWIPKEWDCKTLEELLASVGNSLRSGPFGSALLKSELVENGIPFLGIDNVHTEHFEATFRRFVSLNKFLTLNRYAVRPKDVVITIMGTVGRCCVLPDYIGNALSSKHLWTMTFDQSQVIPELVCWQINYAPWVLSWFKRRAQGAVMDAIQSSTLKTLKLPVPPMPEQLEIFKKYASCNSRIESEQANLRKLQMEKRGLMHDLLTGYVRVPAVY